MNPCPFCKQPAYMHVGQLYRWVECGTCEATGPVKTSEAEAIAAWNEAKQ